MTPRPVELVRAATCSRVWTDQGVGSTASGAGRPGFAGRAELGRRVNLGGSPASSAPQLPYLSNKEHRTFLGIRWDGGRCQILRSNILFRYVFSSPTRLFTPSGNLSKGLVTNSLIGSRSAMRTTLSKVRSRYDHGSQAPPGNHTYTRAQAGPASRPRLCRRRGDGSGGTPPRSRSSLQRSNTAG